MEKKKIYIYIWDRKDEMKVFGHIHKTHICINIYTYIYIHTYIHTYKHIHTHMQGMLFSASQSHGSRGAHAD